MPTSHAVSGARKDAAIPVFSQWEVLVIGRLRLSGTAPRRIARAGKK